MYIPTTFNIDKQFILEAHKAACNEWKRKIETKFPSLFENTYSIGDRFMINGSTYILGRAIATENGGSEISLININTGNCFSNSIKVYDINKVTEMEFKNMVGDWEYSLVKQN
jgi:hypothetical protein